MRATFGCLIALALACAVNAGCSCSSAVHAGCRVNDDCRAIPCEDGEIPACIDGACGCSTDLPIGDIGRYQSMALRGPTAYICAYNNTYGDLMIGNVTPHDVVKNWSFVDGVPEDVLPDNPLSKVRGGVSDKGDDVGRYCSINVTREGDPVVAYYDGTNGALKFGSFGAVRWHATTVDKGAGKLPLGDDFGRWTSLTFAKDGSPGIAYYAEVAKGPSGGRESQLRFAQAKRPNPSSQTDWIIQTILTKPLPKADPMAPVSVPDGVGLFAQSARKANGAPVIVYYDNSPAGANLGPRGNLMYVEYDAGAKMWKAPEVLDGEDAMGKDTADVGWYPSIAVGLDDVAHIAYTDATHDNLLYVNTKTRTPEVVDDGYRPNDEKTLDGLPAPVYHLVGDSSSIGVSGDTVIISYQDSTVMQLRVAVRDPMKGTWKLDSLAGHGTPFKGAYGFYSQTRVLGSSAVVSSYGINQHVDPPSFFVEVFGVTLQNVIQ